MTDYILKQKYGFLEILNIKPRKRVHGIYKITNTVNNKIYIGETVCIKDRMEQHYSELTSLQHYNKDLQEDVQEYGIENFTVEVLKVLQMKYNRVLLELELLYWEDYYIKQYHAVETGYNKEYTLSKVMNGEKELNYIDDSKRIKYDIYKILNNIIENNGEYKIPTEKLKLNTKDKVYRDIAQSCFAHFYKRMKTIKHFDGYLSLKATTELLGIIYDKLKKNIYIDGVCIRENKNKELEVNYDGVMKLIFCVQGQVSANKKIFTNEYIREIYYGVY